MIEEALVAQLRAAAPGIEVWPMGVPEGIAPPWILYREIDSDSKEGFYAVQHSRTFEIDCSAGVGVAAGHYGETKDLANKIRTALSSGFEQPGACVYQVSTGKSRDLVERSGQREGADRDRDFHWHRAEYSLVFDVPL